MVNTNLRESEKMNLGAFIGKYIIVVAVPIPVARVLKSQLKDIL